VFLCLSGQVLGQDVHVWWERGVIGFKGGEGEGGQGSWLVREGIEGEGSGR
jgi:hypothetical protein